MEVSYSKLLARYQSRNGSWFAVNRKHKVKQKRVKRWLRGNARLLSMRPILHVCWTQAKQTHVFLTNYDKRRQERRNLFPGKKKKKLTS